MNHIPDIVENILQNTMGYVADIRSVDYSVPNSTVAIYSVKHLRPGLIVHFSGFPYGVISVDHSANTFVVVGDMSAETQVLLPIPYFFHGTPIAVNAELSRIREEQKVPFVWLYETIEASGESDQDGNPDYLTAPIRLFFLDSANYGDWTTDDYYANSLTPQKAFAEWFLWFIRENPYKGMRLTGAFSYRLHGPFGAYRENGHFQSIFNEHLAGVELTATFTFKDCSPYKGLNKETSIQEVTPVSQGLQSVLQSPLG